jgi:hypothetical protein
VFKKQISIILFIIFLFSCTSPVKPALTHDAYKNYKPEPKTVFLIYKPKTEVFELGVTSNEPLAEESKTVAQHVTKSIGEFLTNKDYTVFEMSHLTGSSVQLDSIQPMLEAVGNTIQSNIIPYGSKKNLIPTMSKSFNLSVGDISKALEEADAELLVYPVVMNVIKSSGRKGAEFALAVASAFLGGGASTTVTLSYYMILIANKKGDVVWVGANTISNAGFEDFSDVKKYTTDLFKKAKIAH